MATFSVRVPDDLAARFDAVAGDDGRSALLRRLVNEVVAAPPGGAGGPRELRSSARLMVRLTSAEAAFVAAEAHRLGLPRSTWVAALVRRRARGAPTFSQADHLALDAARRELRRIGVNVNQIARALNTAVMEGRVLAAELSAVDDLRRELRGHMTVVREAFEGNLAYWAVDI